MTLDVRGRSGGLAMEWKLCAAKLLNSWGMESILGAELLSVDLGTSISVINVYGPYVNQFPFWDSLLQETLLGGDSVVVGGDLNFTLG